MVKVLVFVVGVLAGVSLALQVARSSRGAGVVPAVNGPTGEFLRAVGDSYRARRDQDR